METTYYTATATKTFITLTIEKKVCIIDVETCQNLTKCFEP